MKYLLLILLISCGKSTHTVEVEGIPDNLEIIHTVNIEKLKTDILELCEQNNDTQEEVEQCIDDNIEDILGLIGELQDD